MPKLRHAALVGVVLSTISHPLGLRLGSLDGTGAVSTERVQPPNPCKTVGGNDLCKGLFTDRMEKTEQESAKILEDLYKKTAPFWATGAQALQRAGNGPTLETKLISDAARVPIDKLKRNAAVVIATISVTAPGVSPDPVYPMAIPANTPAKKVFFVVVTDAKAGRHSDIKKSTTVARWELWGIDSIQRIGYAEVKQSGNFRECDRGHTTIPEPIAFYRCDQAIGLQRILAQYTRPESTSVLLRRLGLAKLDSKGPLSDSATTILFRGGTRSVPVWAQQSSMKTLLGLLQQVDDGPAWMTCALGCCTVDW